MKSNDSLNNARKAKYDEFYTRMEDIEAELSHYKQHFKDKIIYCNCDDFEFSNFWKYFEKNFHHLGLKKLIATCYKKDSLVYKVELFKDVDNNLKFTKTPLKGNGDFRSEECVEILKKVDIVITNPPFSLLEEYILQLKEYGKKFIIVGNQNVLTYKNIFPLFKENEIWLGYNRKGMKFKVPEDFPNISKCTSDDNENWYFGLGVARWLTNLTHGKEVKLQFYKKYTKEDYPFYDNYHAINVSKTKDIPVDYYDIMGVPISFSDVYDYEEFEILGVATGCKGITGIPCSGDDAHALINNKRVYTRIFIRRKK